MALGSQVGKFILISMAGTRTIIVDDAPFIREVVSQALTRHGFEVVGEAADGLEAVEKAMLLKPDLILMDVVMPKKSGIDATKEILQVLPNVRIVAISTVDQQSMVLKALDAGCCDYVAKPFETEKLIQTLRRALAK